MAKFVFFCLFAWCYFNTWAQPGTEIYLFELHLGKGKVSIKNPRNITNRMGYDNQPFFHPNKPTLYYSSANEDGRTDVIEYDYKKNAGKKLTQTRTWEYSPAVTPDKQFISCIVQRDSGEQDLVKYPIGGGEPQVLINDHIIGYHAWADANNVAIFTLPQPFKLHIVNLINKTDTILAENIGRSLHKIPGDNAISFMQRTGTDEWNINRLDLKTRTISLITKGLPGPEHYMGWSPDGKILISDKNKLFFFSPGKSTSWAEVVIVTDHPLNTFSRVSISADGKTLALVVNE